LIYDLTVRVYLYDRLLLLREESESQLVQPGCLHVYETSALLVLLLLLPLIVLWASIDALHVPLDDHLLLLIDYEMPVFPEPAGDAVLSAEDLVEGALLIKNCLVFFDMLAQGGLDEAKLQMEGLLGGLVLGEHILQVGF
jgi:hypothetical protein